MNAVTQKPTRRIGRNVLLLCLWPLIVAGCSPDGLPVGQNAPPVADAGADETVDAGASVTLDGSGSSGGSLSFSWKQLSGTPVSLSGTSNPIATFTAPSNGTALVFKLTVSNAKGNSADEVNISVHPVEESARIVEMRQPSVKDDPAVMGDFPDGWAIPGLPEGPQKIGKGAPTWIDQIEYAPTAEIDLAPGTIHEVELQVPGASILMGTVKWIGTADSLPVILALDGAPLVTGTGYGSGTSYSIGTDRGGSAVRSKTAAGGRATLSVTNTSAATVTVRIIFGAVAL